MLHRQGGKVHQISVWPVQKIPVHVAMLRSVPHERPHTCGCNQGTQRANSDSGGVHSWHKLGGGVRRRPTSMRLFDSVCVQGCSLILFVQVELKKCSFRTQSQFTIACHNPGNLRNRRMIISVARCIKGLPAMSVSFRINVSNMLEIRVLSASARRCGLRLRTL